MDDNNFFSDTEIEETEQSVLEKETTDSASGNSGVSNDENSKNELLNDEGTVTDTPIVLPPADKAPTKALDKGFKAFVIILAVAVAISACSLGGYFLGRNSVFKGNTDIVLDLEAKPKDTDEYSAAQVYSIVNKSVVGIVVYNEAGLSASASGVVYSEDGFIITNDHIYSAIPAPKFKIYTYDGSEYDAKYVAGDNRSDLAVLKIDSKGFYPAVFGNSQELVIGENVVAIGRPSTAQTESSITTGIVSLTERRLAITSSYSTKFIQTNAAINPGSSGGALVNMYGQVIGITSSKVATADYEGVGFAIPTTEVKKVVDSLIGSGEVANRAKIGITYYALDSVTAEINGFSVTGLYVDSVTSDSKFYGKLSQGDIITHLNGTQIDSDTDVLNFIDSAKPGDVVTFTVVTAKGNNKTVSGELIKAETVSSFILKSQESTSSSTNSEFDFPFGD